MKPKDRVHAALRREPVDRVPIFLWYHPHIAARLGDLLEIPPSRVAEAMGDDVRQTWVANNYAMEGIVHPNEGEGHTDDWGIEWIKVGPFNQITHSPLADASRDEILAYTFPYHAVDRFLDNMRPVVACADRFFIGCDVSPCALEMVYRLRGMEGALLDLAADPEVSEAMIARAAAFARHLAELACDRFPLDWLWTGDDVGGQQGMILSPQLWRERVRPHLEPIFAAGRERGLWVAYHSCGAIRPILPDLIEMGLDVLNPVQCNCPGMDPLDLKREFGRDLAFMGGVDTQGVLPHGTVGEVRRATERLLEGMTADGGGYILAASHVVPPETPLENVFALYEVAGVARDEIEDRAADIRVQVRRLALRKERVV